MEPDKVAHDDREAKFSSGRREYTSSTENPSWSCVFREAWVDEVSLTEDSQSPSLTLSARLSSSSYPDAFAPPLVVKPLKKPYKQLVLASGRTPVEWWHRLLNQNVAMSPLRERLFISMEDEPCKITVQRRKTSGNKRLTSFKLKRNGDTRYRIIYSNQSDFSTFFYNEVSDIMSTIS